MVQFIKASNSYDFNFATASYAYMNKYPNPFAKHVQSSDTLEQYVDDSGMLRTTKLVVKRGSLPLFIQPFLGSSLDSWILEKSVIDPRSGIMSAYCSNVDHRKFIKVEEYLHYTSEGTRTHIESKVKLSSNFAGMKERIELWGHRRFQKNMSQSQEGLKYVMNKFKQRMRQETWKI
ncbi:uncharacterized protein CXQ87_004870 [Candidozyma duobushaemuli]|uniref:PRELI/MSF1 domain-containing protein n=1 Tax=Candidozyma duobushaemuli TaxID=1231522 RepID=A0A2V1AFT8_9ASCO|nr:uncharacterized protein CXQ87_004870 [[Candida] duobushaemulonis]PVH16575.1 hypothetical protein CXQ87_004870 [[Candida] duobushaemulonis]